MARKDRINYGTLRNMGTVNVDGVVGVGGDNLQDDVTLIQALFQYIAISSDYARTRLGIAMGEIPLATGELNTPTVNAIMNFQRKNIDKVLRVDGKIHPASYANRVVSGHQKHFMSIMLLHFLASEAALMRNEDEYIPGLIRLAPRLQRSLV